jgi:hypothetical protein
MDTDKDHYDSTPETYRRIVHTPAATTASASTDVIGGQRWSKEPEMMESWLAAQQGASQAPGIDAVLRQLKWRFENILERGPTAPTERDARDGIAAIDAALARAPLPAQGDGSETQRWTCFHCGDSFTDRAAAALHFGSTERQEPICGVSQQRYREMELRMEAYNAEDADIHREMHRMRNEHQQALRRAEEDGYAKGLRDAAPAQAGDARDDMNKRLLDALKRLLERFLIVYGEPASGAVPHEVTIARAAIAASAKEKKA